MRFRQARIIACNARALCAGAQNLLWAASGSELLAYNAEGAVVRRLRASRPVSAVAAAPDGRIFAGQQGQVEIFDRAGKLARTWTDGERLGHVTAIGFTGDDILIADAKDRCLRRYGPALNFLHNIGKDNRMNGFLIPNGSLDFDIDARGLIHACNPGKHRVERYSLDGKLLGHIGRFDGIDPEGFNGCCNPTNAAVDAQGRVFVTEKADPRAKVLSPEGKLLAVISTDFNPAAKNMAITVDRRGRVSVADAAGGKILVFEEVS
jgi:sugar lactone lactonase YvrE